MERPPFPSHAVACCRARVERPLKLAEPPCRAYAGWLNGRPVLLKVHKAAAMASLRIDLCTKQAKVTRVFREGRAECGEAGGERTLTTDPLASGELIFTSS